MKTKEKEIKKIKIKRRIEKGAKEIIEEVELIEKKFSSVIVKLKNGDIIKRKIKDIIKD